MRCATTSCLSLGSLIRLMGTENVCPELSGNGMSLAILHFSNRKQLFSEMLWVPLLSQQVVRETAATTAEKALKQICRLVGGGGGGGLAGASPSAAGILSSVRRMRAERDQLRLRDAASRSQLLTVRPSPAALLQIAL